MKYTCYLYRAPTESECEHGGYCPSYEPHRETVDHCRELPDLCAEIAPTWTGLLSVEASCYPLRRGAWLAVTYQDGAQVTIHRDNMTPASQSRLIEYLSKWL